MWQIVASELRHNWKWMMILFALTSAVWMGITYLPGRVPEVNLAILGMVSALPMLMSLVIFGADQAKRRRRELYTKLSVSQTQRRAGYGMLLLTPWPLAMLNAGLLGRMSTETELPTLLFGWGGVLLVMITGNWLLGLWFGDKAALISALATIFLLLAGPTVSDLLFGPGEGQSPYLWQRLREPLTGLLFYILGALLSLAAITGWLSNQSHRSSSK